MDAGPHTADPAGRGSGPLLPARVLVAAVAVLVVLQALSFVAVSRTASWQLPLDAVCAVAGVAALPTLWRRPVLGGAALGLLAAVSPAATPTATCGAFAVALSRPRRAAVGVAAIGVAAHVLQGVWRAPPGLTLGWWVVLVLVAYATLVGWGSFVQARRALLISLRERAERAETEQARRVSEARTLERTRIAREMHDVLAHRLSLLATHAGALEYRPDAEPERVTTAAAVVRAEAHRALEDLRDVIGVLRTDPTRGPSEEERVARPLPTLAQVPDLVAETLAAGMRVDLRQSVDAADVPDQVGRTAYRVVQEALTNARRHAPGQPVDVSLAADTGGLCVRVANPVDPTTSASPSPGSGRGLIGLTERVELAGGRLQHVEVDGWFRVTARLPLGR